MPLRGRTLWEEKQPGVAAGSWGVRLAAGSGPRDDLKKRLKLMKIQAIFLGAVLSKCKCLRDRALPGRGLTPTGRERVTCSRWSSDSRHVLDSS